MQKELISKTTGKVKRIFIPDVYDNGGYLPEDEVDVIGFVISVDDKELRIIEPRHSEFANVFVGDDLTVNKYVISYNYEEYIETLKGKINLYHSNLSEEKKEQLFRKYYFTKEAYGEFKKIIDYEISVS